MYQDIVINKLKYRSIIDILIVFTEQSGQDTSAYVGDILLKLDAEFPGDVGGFSVYFLNVMKLKKGDAIFLEANLPHAYLSGGRFNVEFVRFVSVPYYNRVNFHILCFLSFFPTFIHIIVNTSK